MCRWEIAELVQPLLCALGVDGSREWRVAEPGGQTTGIAPRRQQLGQPPGGLVNSGYGVRTRRRRRPLSRPESGAAIGQLPTGTITMLSKWRCSLGLATSSLERNEAEFGLDAEVDLARRLVAPLGAEPVVAHGLHVAEVALERAASVHAARAGEAVDEVDRRH